MNVSLTPHFEKFVHSKVKKGLYHSASEVVREGLRLLEEKEAYRAQRIKQLNEDIQVGLDDIEAGRTFSPEEVFARLDKIIATAKARKNLV